MNFFFRKINTIIKKVMFSLELSFTSDYKKIEVYSRYLGFKAGKNCVVTGKINFGSEPYLIEIGNRVRITNNVTFHTHDGGTGVLRDKFPDINVFGRIKVKDNVFLGSNSTILPGVTINENVIVAAGSVVTKDLEADSVYGGVPAKKIKSLKDYELKVLENAVYIHSHEPLKRKNEIMEKISQKEKK